MLRKRTRRSGHVLLPVFGAFYLYTVFLPCTVFGVNLVRYYTEPEAAAQGVTLLGLLAGLGTALIAFFPFAALLIGLPIFIGCLEASAERVGLGATQYFTGSGFREIAAREVFRVALFGLTALCGYQLSLSLPGELQVSGFLAFWQLFLISSFLLFVVPLKNVWPNAFGFEGNPAACYHHIF